jgi:hypothetical protein
MVPSRLCVFSTLLRILTLAQAWTDRRLNLTEKIIEMRAQPLVHTLQALMEEKHHQGFRCLAEPLWVAHTPLSLDVAQQRLHQPVEGKPTFLYCPVRPCRKVYKLRTALNKHLYKHSEFRRLADADRDEILHESTFKLPPNCGLRGSFVRADHNDANDAVLPAGQKRPR